MTATHRLIALGIVISGGAATAIWGHSLILDIVSGVAAIAVTIAVADAIRRR